MARPSVQLRPELVGDHVVLVRRMLIQGAVVLGLCALAWWMEVVIQAWNLAPIVLLPCALYGLFLVCRLWYSGRRAMLGLQWFIALPWFATVVATAYFAVFSASVFDIAMKWSCDACLEAQNSGTQYWRTLTPLLWAQLAVSIVQAIAFGIAMRGLCTFLLPMWTRPSRERWMVLSLLTILVLLVASNHRFYQRVYILSQSWTGLDLRPMTMYRPWIDGIAGVICAWWAVELIVLRHLMLHPAAAVCPYCGYPTADSRHNRCSECGKRINPLQDSPSGRKGNPLAGS